MQGPNTKVCGLESVVDRTQYLTTQGKTHYSLERCLTFSTPIEGQVHIFKKLVVSATIAQLSL